MGKGRGKEKKKPKGGKTGKSHSHAVSVARPSKKASASASGQTVEIKVISTAGRVIPPWESLITRSLKPGVTNLHQANASARKQYQSAKPERRLEIHAETLNITITELQERIKAGTVSHW